MAEAEQGSTGTTGATVPGQPTQTTTAPGHEVGPSGGPSSPKPKQAPTGAGGATGTHTVTKAKVWNETPQGANLDHAYNSMRSTFAVTIPVIRGQLQLLAHRRIGG